MAVAVPPRRTRPRLLPARILTAVPLCDGHDSAIMTINQELVRHGAEVVYLGYHQSAAAIAQAAVQEDVDAIGISSYNGGHVAFFREVVRELRARGGAGIRLFGGGGGTITADDERLMRRAGVTRVFFAGTALATIVAEVTRRSPRRAAPNARQGDRALARAITWLETEQWTDRPAAGRNSRSRPTPQPSRRNSAAPRSSPFVLGIAGPGGAGKSTLIDELTHRFLADQRHGRIALLANDPSHAQSGGALLGDRVSAIYAPDPRVFFRSLATRGSLSGLSPAAAPAIDLFRQAGEFALVLVESVGIGQESDPFATLTHSGSLVDATLFVLSPHYGGRVQLDKIGLLDGADLVALNKCDDPRAATARAEVAARLRRNARPTPLHFTTAARHDDPGVGLLYATIADLAGFDTAGGERACQLRVHA